MGWNCVEGILLQRPLLFSMRGSQWRQGLPWTSLGTRYPLRIQGLGLGWRSGPAISLWEWGTVRAGTCNWVLKDRVEGSPKSCETAEYVPKTHTHNIKCLQSFHQTSQSEHQELSTLQGTTLPLVPTSALYLTFLGKDIIYKCSAQLGPRVKREG